MYKAVIFDFFGVIHADPYQRWLNKHGFKRGGEFADLSDMVDKNLITWQEFFQRLSALSKQTEAEIKEAFYDDRMIDESLVNLIKELKKSYKIGLLSNASNAYLRPILEEHGIAGLFDVDIISSEVGIIKPDPEIFKLTVEKLGVEPAETVFIDDNSYNTDSARTLGITAIHYKDLASLKAELNELGIEAN
ncbi:MAG TPA: HAD family phosphatase [Candidatus Saccharimonadales bacterium]|nr:HAD family phosphatase [Candidatus Saccharimonadales bacterium]